MQTIHKAEFLHRDIAPDNIIIRNSGDPVLIDFGAARSDIAAHSKTKTVSALVKPGYSPYEQYAETSKQQGPWTDIYALAATLYHAVTGKRPPDSPSRMLKDEMIPAHDAALSSYRSTFLDAIQNGLVAQCQRAAAIGCRMARRVARACSLKNRASSRACASALKPRRASANSARLLGCTSGSSAYAAAA